MPFIHVRAYSGKDKETKQATAQAIIQAASEAWGAPLTAFTVVFEDIDRESWEAEVQAAVVEPLRDLMVIEHGELV